MIIMKQKQESSDIDQHLAATYSSSSSLSSSSASSPHLKSCTNRVHCRSINRSLIMDGSSSSSLFIISLFIASLSLSNFLAAAAPFGEPASRNLDVSAPSWTNPCGNPTMGGGSRPSAPPSASQEILSLLFHSVYNRALKAAKQALEVKNLFVNETFGDPEFELGVQHLRQDWLPQCNTDLDQTRVEDAFLNSFEKLQYFAVGLEQVRLDQIFYSGRHLDHVNDMEFDLIQLLCKLLHGMHIQGNRPRSHISRQVMAQSYRDLRDPSLRNLRDYLIIRDLAHCTNHVVQLFDRLKNSITPASQQS